MNETPKTVGSDWPWKSTTLPPLAPRPVTRELVERVMKGAMKLPPEHDVILMAREPYAVLRITMRGQNEGWDWRRIKREARKGTKSTYRGGWNAPLS